MEMFHDSFELKTLFMNLTSRKYHKFTRVLYEINFSPFLLATTIKRHLKQYIKKHPETVIFLKGNIYVDDVIGNRCAVQQVLSITLEPINIFNESIMQLYKSHRILNPCNSYGKIIVSFPMMIRKHLKRKMSFTKC